MENLRSLLQTEGLGSGGIIPSMDPELRWFHLERGTKLKLHLGDTVVSIPAWFLQQSDDLKPANSSEDVEGDEKYPTNIDPLSSGPFGYNGEENFDN